STFALFYRFQIGKHQFRIDHFDVANGIDRIHHMLDIRVLKAANHLNNRVYLTNMAQELVPEPFAGACAFHESSDIDKFEHSRDDLRRLTHGGEHVEAIVRHGDYSRIVFDCPEKV